MYNGGQQWTMKGNSYYLIYQDYYYHYFRIICGSQRLITNIEFAQFALSKKYTVGNQYFLGSYFLNLTHTLIHPFLSIWSLFLTLVRVFTLVSLFPFIDPASAFIFSLRRRSPLSKQTNYTLDKDRVPIWWRITLLWVEGI